QSQGPNSSHLSSLEDIPHHVLLLLKNAASQIRLTDFVHRLLVWFSIELVWTLYPPRPWTSFLLLAAHLTILVGIALTWNDPSKQKIRSGAKPATKSHED